MDDTRQLVKRSPGTLDYDTFTEEIKETTSTSDNSGDGVPMLRSCRWVTSYMCFVGMVLVFLLRSNITMAFVCLLSSGEGVERSRRGQDVNTTTANQTATAVWNDKTMGLALSAYFYGSIVSPIIGGYMAMKSAKFVMTVIMTTSAIVIMATPAAMTYNAYLTVVLRMAVGLCGGVYEPAMQHLIASWAPKEERGILTAISQSGKVVGNVVSFFLSGVLCSVNFLGGWPLTFYGTGVLGMFWVIVLIFVVYDSPDEHPRISKKEKEYLNIQLSSSKVQVLEKENTTRKTPWLQIITCLPFLACLLVKFVGTWVFNVQSFNQPMWLKDVLDFTVEQNGVYSSLPFIGQFLGSIATGVLMDIGTKKQYTTDTVSKIIFSIGLILPAIAILSLSFLRKEERSLAVCLTIFIATVYSAVPICLRVVIIELSPKYTGLLVGIATTVGCIPGMAAPILTTILTYDGSPEHWAEIFYTCFGLYTGAAVVYLLIGKAEKQSWNDSTGNLIDSTLSLGQCD